MREFKSKKNKILLLFVVLLIVVGGSLLGYKLYRDSIERKEMLEKKAQEELLSEIKNNYGSTVVTVNDAKLYILDGEYKEIGTIAGGVIVNLVEQDLTYETEYFQIVGLDQEYYISYKDVALTEPQTRNNRYQNYILLNKQIVTTDTTTFYLDDKVLYTINKSFTFPVYIIDGDRYYIEYGNQLVYVLKDDIKEEQETINSKEFASEIPVIVYHFVYNSSNGEICNQSICHSVEQFDSHLKYIKENNFFTPTMDEFELFMDGKIRLPKKSVMITVDDGWLAHNASQLLTENKLNGTIFLITSVYDKDYVSTEYVEAHSHTHDMHNGGVCPGGQGGGIKCLDKQTILNDLKISSEMLDNSKALCYPFYEYNDYSISVLKEAGYTMGFAGYYAGGSLKARVGGDKYQIPRITMSNTSSVDYLASIIN